ncbi:MAG: ectoine hydroxylase, partial [Pseudonocardiaceae bacterium]|nr:ectoine hydroxylase [Pseudonocardiaceae bacterium]
MTVSTMPDSYPTRVSDRPRMIERSHPTAWPGTSSGPVTGAEVDSYDRNGYLQVPGLLDTEEVQHYWDELGRL